MEKNKYLGIEFGSTRIKGVVIDKNFNIVKSSDYSWESKYENNNWTYNMEEAIKGLNHVLANLGDLKNVKVVGFSAMMHGYLAFDKNWKLLTPFRTWQNTTTEESAKILTEVFNFNIPQRWSIAHLYQAILNKEDHVKNVAHITTLAGYIHYLLTGTNVLGIGDASGVFPIDPNTKEYDKEMVAKFNDLIKNENLSWKLEDVLPFVLEAGKESGSLTKEGAALINNTLEVGTTFAPCEGDAGTGMVCTNAIRPASGNVSAGTSIFAMVVLNKQLKSVHEEIDIVTTPDGKEVAMIHCNNCTKDTNAWVMMFKEILNLFGTDVDNSTLFTKLYEKSLEGNLDCDGIAVCNYLSGEGVTHLNDGIPFVIREKNTSFSLANFLKASLYSSLATLKIGMDILANEGVEINSLTGHGGYFNTPGVGQRYLAAATNTAITCLKEASVGGPYGMAILCAFVDNDSKYKLLNDYLDNVVFKDVKKTIFSPKREDVDGFTLYMKQFKKALEVEKRAIEEF